MTNSPEYMRKYQKDNAKTIKAYKAEHYQKNKKKYKDKASRWKIDNAQRKKILDRQYHLKHKYGLSIEDYESMLELQQGLCALCGRPETCKANFNDGTKLLAVDHCHETGEIRGLLCTACNTAIAKLGDTAESIERVLRYMKGEF